MHLANSISLGWGRSNSLPLGESSSESVETGAVQTAEAAPSGMTPLGICLSLALSAGICAVSYGAAEVMGIDYLGILLVTVITVALATGAPNVMDRLSGHCELGSILIYVFFVLIASNACVLGPATRGWHALVTPAILVAVFGYVVANIIGITLAKLL